MAQRPLIRLRLAKYNYADLGAFAQQIHDGFVAQVAHYATPAPSMANFQTDITSVNTQITAWGVKGNRVPHSALVALKAAVVQLKIDLTQLADYAMNLDPYDDTYWVLVGFENRTPKSPVGILQKVQNLRQFTSRTINPGSIKIKWKRPLGAPVSGVKSYEVYRFENPVFDAQAPHVTLTKTTFLDDGNSPLGNVDRNQVYYYFVIPVGAAGEGVLSDVLMAQASSVPS